MLGHIPDAVEIIALDNISDDTIIYIGTKSYLMKDMRELNVFHKLLVDKAFDGVIWMRLLQLLIEFGNVAFQHLTSFLYRQGYVGNLLASDCSYSRDLRDLYQIEY